MPPENKYERFKMSNLLVTDHLELDQMLKELSIAFEGGEKVELIHQKLDLFWARLAMHIRAEHLHLFPALLNAAENRNLPPGKEPSPEVIKTKIDELHEDHDFFMRELAIAVKRTQSWLANDQTVSGSEIETVRRSIAALAERLEIHNKLEESEVYRWIDDLSREEKDDLKAKIKKELAKLPPRHIKR